MIQVVYKQVETETTVHKADFVLLMAGLETNITVPYYQPFKYLTEEVHHQNALAQGLKTAYFRGLNPTAFDYVIQRRYQSNDEKDPIEWWEEVDSLTYDQVIDVVMGKRPYVAPLHKDPEETADLAEQRAAEIAVEEAERKLETLRMCR